MLDDAAKLLDYSTEIGVGFVLVFVVVTVLKGRANIRRFREEQAQQQALAASLGLRAAGAEPAKSLFQGALASLADGPEKLGPFCRPPEDLRPVRRRVRRRAEGPRDHGLPPLAGHGDR